VNDQGQILNSIFGDDLIPGNMDSLILYGSNEQGKLRSFSKSLAKIITKDQGELDYAMYELTKAIEKFQKASYKRSFINIAIIEKSQHSLLIKKYDEMLVYIEKVTLLLQLQEAQMIKDTKSLQQMVDALKESINSLESRIEKGAALLQTLKGGANLKCDDLDDWIDRLERRLDDMWISHTVSLQSIAQAELMISNYGQLIDKIIVCLTVTIPMWRNQITLLLGIEKIKRNSSLQDKVTDMAENYISEGQHIIKKYEDRKNNKRIDVQKIEEVNSKLTQMLEDLHNLEHEGDNIKNKLIESAY